MFWLLCCRDVDMDTTNMDPDPGNRLNPDPDLSKTLRILNVKF